MGGPTFFLDGRFIGVGLVECGRSSCLCEGAVGAGLVERRRAAGSDLVDVWVMTRFSERVRFLTGFYA